MTLENWKALLALLLPSGQIDSYIDKNLRNEDGDVLNFELGFNAVKTAITDKQKQRFDYGLKKRGEEISAKLKELTGIDPNENELAPEHITRVINSLKESSKQIDISTLSDEDLVKIPKVSELISKKGVITKEVIVNHPIYAALAANIKKDTSTEYETKVKNLEIALKNAQDFQSDAILRTHLSNFIDSRKLNIEAAGSKEDALEALFNITKFKAVNGFKEIEGKLQPLTANGEVLKDDSTGFDVGFENYVLKFSPYKPYKNDPTKGSSQAPNGGSISTTPNIKNKRAEDVMLEAQRLFSEGKTVEAQNLIAALENSQK